MKEAADQGLKLDRIAAREGTDEFLLLGSGFSAEFSPPGAPPGSVEIESVDEGSFVDGRWVAGRRLNGDEQYRLLPLDGFAMVRIKLMRPK